MEGGSGFARFGSGRSVRRVEDEALVKGAGRSPTTAAAPGELRSLLRALEQAACAHRLDRHGRRAGDAGRDRQSSPARTLSTPA